MKLKIEEQLKEFIVNTFGPYPQNKNEIGLYLKNFALSKEYIEENTDLFDIVILDKFKPYIVYQFGEEFYEKIYLHISKI
jgi:hypothetical protein